jgi:Mg2+-importing ATPase
MADKHPWSLSLEDLFTATKSSPAGLSSSEAARRIAQSGKNVLQAKKQASALSLFLNQFRSPIILILLFATGLSAVLRDWADAVIILLIVFGSALLSFFQEFNASNAAEKLRSQVSLRASVLRDGQMQSILAEDVATGDIVLLSAGSLIPADGITLETKDFFVSQAVLTGETFPVEKNPGTVASAASLVERTNMVFMGTNVRSGSARMLVVETGPRTSFGQIASRLALRPPETEFERGIRRLGNLLTEFMLVLVILIFALNVFFHKPVLDSLMFSIALAVGLTPQLLPAIININLSKGSQEMAKQGVIVRRMEAIENFGSMDMLCTDKTGTLTEGVVKLDATLDVQGKTSDQVHFWAYLNAHFQTGLPNPMDEAILQQPLEMGEVSKVDEIPYDFLRRRLSVVVQQDGKNFLVTKGALENVLEVCSSVLEAGEVSLLGERLLASIHQQYEAWSEKGYRVLGVAVKEVSIQADPFHPKDEVGLTFWGFLLFFDPPKAGVLETVKELEGLGVQLKIITGDNHLVAHHTAQAVGLLDASVLTGAQLDELHNEALWHTAEKTTIFAEVDPNQKERIILALKKSGHVVGYMGDGINDAPSLHSADVGISVQNAVDVAKDAADFVLLRQDLDVLKQGILLGRKNFANTLKYVFMATSANFGNMFSMAGASLFLPFLPMLPKQILLINFLTDLPEMAIAGDNVDQAFLKCPHRWNIGFIKRFMLVFGPLSSIFDFLTFGLLLWGVHAGQAEFHTGWLIESVLSASLVVFAVRTRLPFFHSRPSRSMLWMTALVGLVALTLPYSPLAGLLGLHPLPIKILLFIGLIILLYFTSAEVLKRWFFKHFDA